MERTSLAPASRAVLWQTFRFLRRYGYQQRQVKLQFALGKGKQKLLDKRILKT